MGIAIRESIKSSIASYLGVLIGSINIVLLYTRFLSTEQLGLTRVLQDTTLLFVSLAQLGSPFIIIKFFPHFQNKENNNNGFLFFSIIYSIIGFLIFTFIFLLFHKTLAGIYLSKSPLIVDYLYYIIPYVFGFILLNIFEAYIIVNSKVFYPTFIREVFIKLSNTLLIILLGFYIIDFSQFILLLILAHFIASFLLLVYIKRFDNFSLRPDFSIFKSDKFKNILNYGFFTVLGGIGYVLATKIDIIMLAAYKGLKQTAIYTIAIFIATLMEIPKKSLNKSVTSALSFAIKNDDKDIIETLYKKTSINLFIFGSILFIVLWTNINDLFLIMPRGEIYQAGKIVLFIFLTGRLLDLLSGINSEIILYSKYYRYTILFTLLLGLLTIATNIIFIPIYGILGAAIATFLSLFVFIIARIIFVWIKFQMHPFNLNTLKIILIFLVFFFISLQLNSPFSNFVHNYLSGFNHIIVSIILICIKSLLLVSLFVTIVIKFNISQDFSNLISVSILKLKNVFKSNKI
ncbi:MAG: oligosaccharide flippase family protein [Bacteroidetes bacterium]|nr:oligosaccharide flippase family protein [Bacteroidota bacterium]